MYTHVEEGLDDMTSHIKSSLLGSSVSFPIKNGKLNGVFGKEFFYANTGINLESVNNYNSLWRVGNL